CGAGAECTGRERPGGRATPRSRRGGGQRRGSELDQSDVGRDGGPEAQHLGGPARVGGHVADVAEPVAADDGRGEPTVVARGEGGPPFSAGGPGAPAERPGAGGGAP